MHIDKPLIETATQSTINHNELVPVPLRQYKDKLTTLSKEHTFFQPWIFMCMGLPFDPIQLFWTEKGLSKDEAPFLVQLDTPIWLGLPQEVHSTVVAVPKQYDTELIRHLGTICLSIKDDAESKYMEALHQVVELQDTPVNVYGLVSSMVIYHWVPKRKGDVYELHSDYNDGITPLGYTALSLSNRRSLG